MREGTDGESLDRLAGAVSDGAPVDWDRELRLEPGMTQELENLRAMARIHASTEQETETASHGSATPSSRSARSKPLFTWGHLEVLEHIGGGTFGDVYRAFDPALQKEVALKLRRAAQPQDDDSAQKFLSEARRLARVDHPNVVTVHGVGDWDGRIGIWTELVSGETLERRIAQHGPLGAREAAGVGIEVCRALAAVHQAGLIHRDVKTSNIMRDARARIVLMDFGSGGDLPALGSALETYNIQGTPLFMAPEHLQGVIVGPPTDIYGLGVVLYRLVTREFPTVATSIPELLERHERGPVPLRDRRPDLPAEFVQVVHRAIARDPGERYATAGELELALAKAMHRDAPAPLPWWRQPAVLASGGVVAAALIAWVLIDGPGKKPPETSAPAPPPAVSAAGVTASASLYRSKPSGNELLLPGVRLRPNDKLFMEFSAPVPMHVYVLNEDDSGHVFVLFPLPEVQPKNPLAPGTRHRLPGRLDGTPYTWSATSAGGTESFMTIASPEALPALERAIAEFPTAQPGRPFRLSAEAVDRIRGIGGLVEAPEETPTAGASRLTDVLARALGTTDSENKRIWFQQLRLQNP